MCVFAHVNEGTAEKIGRRREKKNRRGRDSKQGKREKVSKRKGKEQKERRRDLFKVEQIAGLKCESC